MALSVNNNAAALNTYRNLTTTQGSLSKSLEKLSSGFRINRAADDAAGLAISEGLRSQISGLTQASRNAQDGINVVQTAEGALNETTSILQRMRTLAVQASNGGAQSADSQKAADKEFQELKKELGDISSQTQFNGVKLLDGKYSSQFQIGANKDEKLELVINNGTDDTGFSDTDLALSDDKLADGDGDTAVADGVTASQTALEHIDAAIKLVSTARATLGATQNRLEHKINNLNVTTENLTASESQIRDTDMASEMVKFTSKQILSQAGTAMLAQAKSLPQSILSLLQN